MKTTKYIWAAGALVLALVGTWAGHILWCAHRNLVTLHVRNAPLAEVIRKIERQTWEHISVDPKLNSLITLNVKNKPLAEALDRIGQQCGARWTSVYAVYGLESALPKLESSLFGDKKLDEVGWKMIAPPGLDQAGTTGIPIEFNGGPGSPLTISNGMAVAGGGGGGGGGGQPRIVINGGPMPSPQDLPPGAVISTEDSVIKGGGGRIQGRQGQGAPVMVTMRRRADGSGAMEQEIWSPVQLVLESRLNDRLGENYVTSPSPEGAAQTAKKVKGKWKLYYALKKSSMPMNMPGGSRMRTFTSNEPGKAMQMVKQNGTNSAVNLKPALPSIDDLAQSIQQQKLEDLARLTPEQRVLRAREKKQQQIK